MYYIYDSEDYIDDFATLTTIRDITEIAHLNKLSRVSDFLKDGYTIEIPKLINEIEGFEWPIIDFINETMASLVVTLERCDEIAIIHDASE